MPFSWRKKQPPVPVNPLTIPKVLSKVLINLSVKEMSKFRLVNVTWNQAVCALMRKNRVIEFSSVNSLFSYMTHYQRTKDFPHSSYEFSYCTLRELKAEQRHPEALDTFFRIFGPHITFLHLSLEREYFGVISLRNVLENNVPNLVNLDLTFSGVFGEGLSYETRPFELHNLRNLTVDILSYESSVKNVELVIRDILSASPNLRKLSSEDLARQTSPILAEILTQSILSVDPSKLRYITHLEFMAPLDNARMSTLLKSSFPLEVAFIELKSNVDTEILQQFLINFCKTLRKLHLEFPQDDLKIHMFRCVVPMKVLNFLSLTNFQGSLDLLGNLPELHTLELRKSNLAEVIPHQNFATALTALDLDSCRGSLNILVMKKVGECFATLTKLHLTEANNEILRAVYEGLPALEDLDIKGDNITDEGISGIPDKISKQLTDAESFAGFAKYAKCFRQFSFIGNLKNLRTLNLESNSITNVSVVFGLMQCEHLHKLRLASFLGLLTEISLEAIAKHQNLTNANIYLPTRGWVDFKRLRKSSKKMPPKPLGN